MIPIRKGKFILIIPGVNTFPNAIPTPINIVPTYNQDTPVIALKAIPTHINISAPKTVRSNPNLWLILAANSEITANESNGIIVIKLTDVLDKFKVSLIEGSAIPTEVIGALKLAPINKMPINNIKLFFLFLFILSTFLLSP